MEADHSACSVKNVRDPSDDVAVQEGVVVLGPRLRPERNMHTKH